METKFDALATFENITHTGDTKQPQELQDAIIKNLTAIFDPLPFGYIIHHSSGIKFANKAACDILEVDKDSILDTYFMKYVTSNAQADVKALFLQAFKSGANNELREIRIPQKDAESRIVDVTIARLPWDGKGTPLVQLILEDNTEHLRKEAQLVQLSSLDPLTGAQNRRSFTEYYERVFNLFKGDSFGLILFDLDHFKKVNDTYGHEGGDMALQITVVCTEAILARKTVELKRDQQRPMLARVGGEEFAIFIPHADLPETLEIAESVREAIAEQEIITQSDTFQIAASMGVASATFDKPRLDEVMRRADAALYAAKEGGRNQVVAAQDDHAAPPEAQRIARAADRPKLTGT
ncbi:hypothetical protein GCM10017044_27470 [Kordiimonas sediminis]|uniref:diguanylate cyclase n=1 Tax=Kordiimonas sediminis TaxID=1735581 RepID=A0A919AZ75_9PROT|nr:sensor domain-containing diguanylate cyclase [Kordiimonas sediminis]GHF30596.1 hypothetical protein GCM10017044_27470 [Kordiimonas sediminis]